MFITFEGIEGSGKSTLAKALFLRLKKRGFDTVFTKEPGGTPIGERIRDILLSSKSRELIPLSELFLYEADRAQHYYEVIIPAIKQGKWVVCDRSFDATLVYQGIARGLDLRLIRDLNSLATQGLAPDLTFLLDCPVDIALSRAKKRIYQQYQACEDRYDRFESEAMEFHERVRQGYLIISKEDPRFVVLDSSRPSPLLEEEICKILKERKGIDLVL